MPKYRKKRSALLSITITTFVTFMIFSALTIFTDASARHGALSFQAPSFEGFLHRVPLLLVIAVGVGFFDWFLQLRHRIG
jgi:hypothetical protein